MDAPLWRGGGVTVQPNWPSSSYSASVLLALGSSLLFAGSVVQLGWVRWPWMNLPVYIGMVALLAGWLGLGMSLTGSRRRASRRQSLLRPTGVAYLGSLIGFGLGMIVILWAYPGSLWYLVSPSLPYIPVVSGPIVICQAIMFLLGSRLLIHESSASELVAGSAYLVTLASLAIAGQVLSFRLGLELPLIWSLAGFTGPGYAMVADALRRQLKKE